MLRTLVCLLLLVTTAGCGAQEPSSSFQSAATLEQVQAQHRRLPADDIWWTVNGPDMAWNFKNLHQLFPTVNVYRGGDIAKLVHKPLPAINDFLVDTPPGKIRFQDFIDSDASTAMGVVVLHKGDIVFEQYPRMQAYEMPIYWSVAKVFTGTLVRILEERGLVDVSLAVEHYIPELENSALAGTTIRNILDMASGLDCADDYVLRTSCYYQYSIAIGDGHWQAGDSRDPYAFVAGLEANRLSPQGERFSYSGLNTFVLAWLVEKVTGMPFQDALSKEIWFKMGAEANGSYIAPHSGVAVTHGGFFSRMRDLARFGLLFTPSYHKVSRSRLISQSHVDFLLNEGNPALLKNAEASAPGVKYNIYQWDTVFEDGTLYKGGWAGQGLLINPAWDVVVVYTSYFKDDQYSELPLHPRVLQVIRGVFGPSGQKN